MDAALGTELPRIEFCDQISGEKLLDPTANHFSTGEAHIFYLVNFILEVERKVAEGLPLTIILDDIVDSFDYKNKYGILDYFRNLICERDDHKRIQLLLLTHNFDFFRSAALMLGGVPCREKKLYFAYADYANERHASFDVTFADVTSEGYYIEAAKFNEWHSNPTLCQYYSCLIFQRTVQQLSLGTSNNHLISAYDDYLHYDLRDQDNKTVDALISLPGMPSASNLPEIVAGSHYMKTVIKTAKEIVDSGLTAETNLAEKLTIGLAIRLLRERFYAKTILDSGRSLNGVNHENREQEFNRLIGSSVPLETKSKLRFARLISSPLMHVNSMMYEPIIDANPSELSRAFNDMYHLNLTWHIN